MKKKIILNPYNFGSLAIYAIRYCHNRQSYAPNDVRGIIRPYLSQINDHDLQIMIQDCKFQEDMNLYGDERIDKPGWLKWKEELLKEQKRRQK